MGTCKICGKKADSDYCFQHKLRKKISSKHSNNHNKVNKNIAIKTMQEFFISIWNKKPHICENCGKWLGNEPLSYMFDHLLEKSKHPELKYEEDNIMITCLECHENKTNGFLSEIVNKKIINIRKKFGK